MKYLLKESKMELCFYDKLGKPFAYMMEETTIYTFNGEPVAYIEYEDIYAFEGSHLGYLEDGNVWDHNGDMLLFTDISRFGVGPLKPKKSLKTKKGLKSRIPLKGKKDLKLRKPLKSRNWSLCSPVDVFITG